MKKTIKNKKLLLGLGAIISITSITSILSCSKPDTNSPTNPDNNGGSNGVKPEPNPEPGDGKQYLNIQNHKFDIGSERWEDFYNFLPQIEFDKIRWVDQQNNPIEYKVKLQINPSRMRGNKNSNENFPYDLKSNFYKIMNVGLDLEFIFKFDFHDNDIQPIVEIKPLNWEYRAKDGFGISLQLDKAFSYCYENKKIGTLEKLVVRKEDDYFKMYLDNGINFDLEENDKNIFQKDDANVNQAYMTNEQKDGEKWYNSNSYKNLSGTISIERVDK